MSDNAEGMTPNNRIASIDIARGVVMVLMTLDHVRDYFHKDALAFNPTDLTKTNAALFFTRWVTHFCAPAFVLLAGASIYLSLQRKTKKELSRFLLTRGLWLMLIELTVMRFGLFFNLFYDVTILNIIWVIGLCMVCMSAMIRLSDRWILGIGLVLIFFHNATGDSLPVLMSVGFIPLSPSFALIVSYPLFPWLGVMMIGYWVGKLYTPAFDSRKRQRILSIIGLSMIVLFLILRFLNIYGDPAPWSDQQDKLLTEISFLNVTKYPLSLLFTLMTLGPVILLLALLENHSGRLLKPFYVLGRVPLFYFVLHFYLAHAAALLLFILKTGKSFSEIDFHFAKSFGGITPEGGYSLPWVYLAWLAVILSLYPLCQWYNNYKTKNGYWWLSYL